LNTKKTRLLIISSREVYPARNDFAPLIEDDSKVESPSSQYGINKKFTEINCIKSYPIDKLLIIRASNIIGLEPGRKTFMGLAQKSLKDYGEILLDIAGESKKDFLPVEVFTKYLLDLIIFNYSGIINVGSGLAFSVNKICNLLIKGYGSGKLIFQDESVISGQFVLDVSKLNAVTKKPFKSNQLDDYIVSLGNQLKELN